MRALIQMSGRLDLDLGSCCSDSLFLLGGESQRVVQELELVYLEGLEKNP